MKTISGEDEHAIYECEKCNHQFDVDACFEENLEFSEKYKCLLAVCPNCGRRQEDEWNEMGAKLI